MYVLYRTVPGASALGKYIEIMPVKMHRMCNRKVIPDHNPDRRVGAKVIDVPLWIIRIGGVPLVGEDEDRMAVAVVRTVGSWEAQLNSLIICTEGFPIHEPYKVAA